MDLYTMNENFIANSVVDEFVSVIWTERYSSAGDVQLVTAATPELREKLAEGTFLGLRGSKEVMQIKTQSVEDNTMTVVGVSLLGFLDERMAWFKNTAYSSGTDTPDKKIQDFVVTGKVGQVVADVVEDMVISPSSLGGTFATADLSWALDAIEHLELGPVDTSGDDERVTITVGPLYSSIQQVAAQEGLGISLYLDFSSVDSGYVLKFKTYRGQNRTTSLSNAENANEYDVTDPPASVSSGAQLVRLVPDMDSLSDVKELHSIEYYKNVAYVFYQGIVTTHYEDPANIPEGFKRRVLLVTAEGEPVGRKVSYLKPYYRDRMLGGERYATYTVVGAEEIAKFRAQQAKDALANHNYIRAVDGQTSPHNDYKYGVHYELGDLIELQGLTGTLSKARVTEYIRSQDRTGEREYPTISVV